MRLSCNQICRDSNSVENLVFPTVFPKNIIDMHKQCISSLGLNILHLVLGTLDFISNLNALTLEEKEGEGEEKEGKDEGKEGRTWDSWHGAQKLLGSLEIFV